MLDSGLRLFAFGDIADAGDQVGDLIEFNARERHLAVELGAVKAALAPLKLLGYAIQRRLHIAACFGDGKGAVPLIFGPEAFGGVAGELFERAVVEFQRGVVALHHAIVLQDKNRISGGVKDFAIALLGAVEGVYSEKLGEQIGDGHGVVLLHRRPDARRPHVLDTEHTYGFAHLSQGGIEQAGDTQRLKISGAKACRLRRGERIGNGQNPTIKHGGEVGAVVVNENFQCWFVHTMLAIPEQLAIKAVSAAEAPEPHSLNLQVLRAVVQHSPQARIYVPLPEALLFQQLDVGVVQGLARRWPMLWLFGHENMVLARDCIKRSPESPVPPRFMAQTSRPRG